MRITAIGCGNAFTKKNGNQMFMLEENGERFFIDFGFQASQSILDYNTFSEKDTLSNLKELVGEEAYNKLIENKFEFKQRDSSKPQLTLQNVDCVYISHQHADHAGGLEELAFTLYDWVNKPQLAKDFKNRKPVKLFIEKGLKEKLWDKTLSGGLESMEGFVSSIDTFFEVIPVECNQGFDWQGWHFSLIQQVHVMTGSEFMPSFGLFMEKEGHKTVYFTTDSQYDSPKQIKSWYAKADIILQDCEIIPFMSGVHANYIELAGMEEANAAKLPEAIKSKMWLSHYQDFYNDGLKMVVKSPSLPFYENTKEQDGFVGFEKFNWDAQAQADGFAGFLQRNQEFEV